MVSMVTASIFFIQVLVALPCAYALAKLRFWGREAVFGLVLFCLLIPVHAIALPLYIMLAKLGLTNTYAALIIPWTISVFGIFLMRQFFMTVPDDLIDAARMDGMSEFSIIWNVMLPTAIPALLGLRDLLGGCPLERLFLAAHRRSPATAPCSRHRSVCANSRAMRTATISAR